MHRHLGDVKLAVADGLGNLLRGLAGLHHGVAHIEHHALAEHTFALQLFHHHVGHGHVVLVYTVDAKEAAKGALHCHGGVVLDEILHLSRYAAGHVTCVLNLCKIKSYFTFLHCCYIVWFIVLHYNLDCKDTTFFLHSKNIFIRR